MEEIGKPHGDKYSVSISQSAEAPIGGSMIDLPKTEPEKKPYPIDTAVKRYFILKTNGIANIRAINCGIGAAPETPTFWMAGYMVPRKLRSTTVLRKQFLYYDYAFVALYDPIAFEAFLTERKIPAYFLHIPGTKKIKF